MQLQMVDRTKPTEQQAAELGWRAALLQLHVCARPRQASARRLTRLGRRVWCGEQRWCSRTRHLLLDFEPAAKPAGAMIGRWRRCVGFGAQQGQPQPAILRHCLMRSWRSLSRFSATGVRVSLTPMCGFSLPSHDRVLHRLKRSPQCSHAPRWSRSRLCVKQVSQFHLGPLIARMDRTSTSCHRAALD